MNSSMTTGNELPAQLLQIGLRATAQGLDDLIARAVKQRWSPRQLLEEMARAEMAEKAARNLQRRLRAARLGRFKPLADFYWNWPKKRAKRIRTVTTWRPVAPSLHTTSHTGSS